jgi:hypothetical protein
MSLFTEELRRGLPRSKPPDWKISLIEGKSFGRIKPGESRIKLMCGNRQGGGGDFPNFTKKKNIKSHYANPVNWTCLATVRIQRRRTKTAKVRTPWTFEPSVGWKCTTICWKNFRSGSFIINYWISLIGRKKNPNALLLSRGIRRKGNTSGGIYWRCMKAI